MTVTVGPTQPLCGVSHRLELLDWWVLKSSDNSYYSWSWGTDTDIPGSADFDGDGRADIAVYRPGNQYYYSINSSNGQAQMIFLGQTVSCSIPRECVVPADYDGDGKADFAVYNSPTASWTIRFSVTGQVTTTQWGSSGDVPVHNDYDGDGKCDLATWRSLNALWTIKNPPTAKRERKPSDRQRIFPFLRIIEDNRNPKINV